MNSDSTEKSWLPNDPPIQTKCNGCRRGIPEYFFKEGYSYTVHIFDIPEDELVEKWVLCGDCTDEVTSFAREVLDLTEEDNQENQQDCGFCGDELGDARWEFAFSPTWFDEFEGTVLCENCQNVMANFIEDVPESSPNGPDPDGQVYYPSELSDNPVRAQASSVDDRTIVETFSDLDTGDTVYFEAHRSGFEDEPDQYLCGTGKLEEIREGGLIEPEAHLERIEGVDGFWIRRNEPTRYRLQHKVLMEGNDYLWLLADDDEDDFGQRRPPEFAGHVTVLDPK